MFISMFCDLTSQSTNFQSCRDRLIIINHHSTYHHHQGVGMVLPFSPGIDLERTKSIIYQTVEYKLVIKLRGHFSLGKKGLKFFFYVYVLEVLFL